MSKVLSVLIAAVFASVGFGAVAADDGAKGVRKQADATYKADRKACKALKGQEQTNCMKQAKAKHDQEVGVARGMKKEARASQSSSSGNQGSSSSSSGNASSGNPFANYRFGPDTKPTPAPAGTK